MATVLAELTDSLSSEGLFGLAKISPVPWAQRLGYLLERVDPAFTQDVAPLLGPGVAWDSEDAARYVRQELLARLQGSPWKGADSVL